MKISTVAFLTVCMSCVGFITGYAGRDSEVNKMRDIISQQHEQIDFYQRLETEKVYKGHGAVEPGTVPEVGPPAAK